MKSWKTLALAAALTGAAGFGASVAPPAEAQGRSPRVTVSPRAEVLSIASGGRIGVAIRDVETSDKAKAPGGVVIESVDENSPASKAGLKAGDIVVEFDGERVRSARQFSRLVSETPEGRSVAAAVLRDGQRVTVNLTPEASNTAFRLFNGDEWRALEPFRRFETVPAPARPVPPARPARPAPLPPSLERFFYAGSNQLGITVTELEPQLAEYFGTKEGVLVSSVSADSAAAKAGVKAGDVITSVNGSAVDSTSDVRSRLRDLDGEEFTLGIVRDKKSMTLKGKLEPRTDRRRTTTRTIL
jgi:serine protease Do